MRTFLFLVPLLLAAMPQGCTPVKPADTTITENHEYISPGNYTINGLPVFPDQVPQCGPNPCPEIFKDKKHVAVHKVNKNYESWPVVANSDPLPASQGLKVITQAAPQHYSSLSELAKHAINGMCIVMDSEGYAQEACPDVTLQTNPGGPGSIPLAASAPEWVPDPSAGHYDCPTGWIAYTRSEPQVYSDAPISAAAVFITPPVDEKGHVLGSQPAPPICIQEAKP
jgi:hypothetical protein